MQVNKSKKEQIVKVVLDYITENGNCDISIREIGRLSNVNSAAISYYFGSKDNLILVAIKYYYDLANNIFDVLKEKNVEPQKRMLKFCMAYSEHMIKYIGFLKIQVSQYMNEDDTKLEVEMWFKRNAKLFIAIIEESTGIENKDELKFRSLQLLSSMVYPILLNKYIISVGEFDFRKQETREKYFKSLILKTL